MTKDFIVIHHSATKDGETFNAPAIRKYHTSWRSEGRIVTLQEALALRAEGKRVEEPWAEIGYHYLLDQVDGYIWVLHGRPTDYDGAHCKELSMNQRGIGICLIGNFDVDEPSLFLLAKAKELVDWLRQIYSIPKANVIGHREAQEKAGLPPGRRKSCPGSRLDLNAFRSSLA